MARKRAHAEHENHERWLVSYADFITLLFAFFVVMFATSQTDKAKAQQVSESVKEALEHGGIKAVVHEILGGTVEDKGKGNNQMRGPGGAQKMRREEEKPASKVAELIPSMQYLNKALQAEIDQGKVEVHLEPRGLVVSLREAAFFPSGEDTVNESSYSIMEKIAKLIGSLPNQVRLEGHTDSIPIHTARFRSNWELSAARAIAMMETLTERFALSKSRFAIAGYADTSPADTNDTAEGRAHNRRVDIVILNQQAMIKDEPAPVGAAEAARPKAATAGSTPAAEQKLSPVSKK